MSLNSVVLSGHSKSYPKKRKIVRRKVVYAKLCLIPVLNALHVDYSSTQPLVVEYNIVSFGKLCLNSKSQFLILRCNHTFFFCSKVWLTACHYCLNFPHYVATLRYFCLFTIVMVMTILDYTVDSKQTTAFRCWISFFSVTKASD